MGPERSLPRGNRGRLTILNQGPVKQRVMRIAGPVHSFNRSAQNVRFGSLVDIPRLPSECQLSGGGLK
jgi:hypothetical protein